MYERTSDDWLNSDLTNGNLSTITMALVSKRGRDVALDILKTYDVHTIQDLKLRDLRAYHEAVLAELAKSANPLPTQEQWDAHAKRWPLTHKALLTRLRRVYAPALSKP